MFYFEAEKNTVVLRINTRYEIQKPVIPLEFQCEYDLWAKLLADRLNDLVDDYKKQISKNAFWYLDNDERRELKATFRRWNTRTNSWKS